MDTNSPPTSVPSKLAYSGLFRSAGAPRVVPGAEIIQQQIGDGTTRIRVGLASDKRPVREESLLFDDAGTGIGFVSSGGFGPTFNGPIAMGYVPPEYQQPGHTITAVQRGKEIAMTVTDLPFAPHNYYRG